MTNFSAFAGLAVLGIRSPMMELRQEVDEAVACGRALGLTHDESREVIREMNAAYRALLASPSWAVVRQRMIARSMGLPWRQADVEAARLAPPPSPEREEKETQ